jgi:hypothetical protein
MELEIKSAIAAKDRKSSARQKKRATILESCGDALSAVSATPLSP